MSETRNRDGRGRLLPGPATDYSRYARGDRDQAARDAKAAHERDRAVAPASSIIYTAQLTVRAGTKLTAEHAAMLQARIAELGITEAEYVRDLILTDLDVTDTTRRAAPRRPARGQREEQGR